MIIQTMKGYVRTLIPVPLHMVLSSIQSVLVKEGELFEEGTIEHSVSHPATAECFMEVY